MMMMYNNLLNLYDYPISQLVLWMLNYLENIGRRFMKCELNEKSSPRGRRSSCNLIHFKCQSLGGTKKNDHIKECNENLGACQVNYCNWNLKESLNIFKL